MGGLGIRAMEWAWDALKSNGTTLVVVAAIVVLFRYVLRPLASDICVVAKTLALALSAAKDAARDARDCANVLQALGVKRDA